MHCKRDTSLARLDDTKGFTNQLIECSLEVLHAVRFIVAIIQSVTKCIHVYHSQKMV